MKDLPHHYPVRAEMAAEGPVRLASPGVDDLESAPPAEFGGPGDRWSPETLFVASVADCFLLTFRAVARGSKLPWTSLRCHAEGVLDKAEGGMRFTGIELRAELVVPEGTDPDRCERLLQKAEKGCLVSRSLSCPVRLVSELRTG